MALEIGSRNQATLSQIRTRSTGGHQGLLQLRSLASPRKVFLTGSEHKDRFKLLLLPSNRDAQSSKQILNRIDIKQLPALPLHPSPPSTLRPAVPQSSLQAIKKKSRMTRVDCPSAWPLAGRRRAGFWNDGGGWSGGNMWRVDGGWGGGWLDGRSEPNRQ